MATPLAGAAVDNSNIQNLKDIMQSYNRITEACFVRCVSNLNSRQLNSIEEHCVNACSGKFINGNQRIMTSFMQVQTAKQKALMEETEREMQQKSAAAAQELQQPSAASVPAPDASTATSNPSPVASSQDSEGGIPAPDIKTAADMLFSLNAKDSVPSASSSPESNSVQQQES